MKLAEEINNENEFEGAWLSAILKAIFCTDFVPTLRKNIAIINNTNTVSESTPQYLKDEGLVPIQLEDAKKGDVGLYISNGDPSTPDGIVTHLEPFILSNVVSTKGGIALDPGPAVPGRNFAFSENANYQVVTKSQRNTEVVPSDFIGPLLPTQIRTDVKTAPTNNGTNNVDNEEFEKIKTDVKSGG